MIRTYIDWVLDVPWSPNRHVKSRVMPARDAHGYLRILEPAGLPLPRDVMEVHEAGLRERAARERVPFDRDLAVKSVYEIAEPLGIDGDIQQAAGWIADRLRKAGLNSVEIIPTDGHPAVYGEAFLAGPRAPTILMYGHYDVQPVDPIDEWTSPPFEPTVRGENLYARGASDMKGQIFGVLKALEALRPKYRQVLICRDIQQLNIAETAQVLGISEVVRVDMVLEVGAVSEQITVADRPPMVETEQGRVSGKIDRIQLNEMPLNGRNLWSLVALQPGITGRGLAFIGGSASGNDSFDRLAVVASNRRARAFYGREGWTDRGHFDYQAYGEAGPIRVPER